MTTNFLLLEMASRKVTLILEFGDLKNKLKVDGSTPPLELKKLAADKCNITNPVTLLYHDTDVKEWFVVDEDYELTDKDTLKLVFVDEKGNIVKVICIIHFNHFISP